MLLASHPMLSGRRMTPTLAVAHKLCAEVRRRAPGVRCFIRISPHGWSGSGVGAQIGNVIHGIRIKPTARIAKPALAAKMVHILRSAKRR